MPKHVNLASRCYDYKGVPGHRRIFIFMTRKLHCNRVGPIRIVIASYFILQDRNTKISKVLNDIGCRYHNRIFLLN